MARNVALSEKAYGELSRKKNTGESFSSVVLRLLDKDERRPSWRDSIGALKNDAEAEKIYKEILERRHATPVRKMVLKW